MFRTALRNVLSHKARLLMTVLAVMLGVAFVSGTLVFTDTLGNAYRKQSAKSYDNVAVAVTTHTSQSDGKNAGVDTKTLEKIRGLDGVAGATGRVSGFAGVADQDGKLIGNGWSNTGANFAPGKDGKDAQYSFTDGSGPVKDSQIALDRDSADKGKYRVGDTVRVATNGPVKEYTLSGVFTTEDGAVNAGGSLVLFDTPVAQKLYLQPGFFKDVTITAAAGASDQKILDAVGPLLPKDAEAQTGKQLADDQAREIEQGLSNLNTMLLSFAAIALFVGVFLIANTFTMLVAQRTRELALMRAVGASRRQVKRSVMLEALVVGALASVIGFVLGIGLATGLRSAMGSFGAKVPAGPLVVSPTAVLAALAVGVLVTVLAAWLPARRAAKIPPVAAMSSVHAVATTRSLVVRNSIGGVITLLGMAGILGGAAAAGSDGRMLIGAGAFLSLIGIIVLIPLLSRPVIALARPLLNRVFGVAGKLAGQNAVRNPRRTGATASALAIGLTLVTGLTTLGVTLGQAIDKMTTDNIRADYMVAMAGTDALDKSALTALEKAKGVSAVSPQQSTSLEIKDEFHSASAVTPGDVEKVFDLKTVSGSMATLGQGQIAVAEKTAKSNGWKTGDTLPVKFGDDTDGGKAETKNLTVGAVYQDNEFLSPVVVSTSLVAPFEPKPYIPEIWVKMDGGASAANEQALVNALGDNPAMSIMDQQDIRNMFGGMINTMLNIMYGLLGMALIIAVLGVINTLAMSVFERQQEIGMLRAIGLDRRKVKRMIRLEAVVISLFGAVIGVGLGSFLAWAIGETIRSEIPGYALVVPWERIGIFLLLAGVVGVLAALWPARSAARLNMLTAIKTE
ncbi:ABC transporter [Streptomyces lunaelactis]|uniref:ABC transporter n=1 Tax=Streptomyces lunaelactis TaxID=1535768 RepID=A0A2R4T2Y5_9ACTN|nr:FtsX-like permease family protein [Streptomyces lunaelactis]AVZ73444.1 ABC transporter [Streptomyces lunaelactis]NUK01596.1 ABC transporter permease [Streptomyces lunaelactis]NUK10192.1 ABC transporter permease [Streptomyces lunaelactis]NUK19024.1 ABC transporter permease [Streptomyces lunaelactis]NUK22739.1 ABC transporter permease [Streptomyces lunaelactis]